MKPKIAILSSLLCVIQGAAIASDCGGDCYTEPVHYHNAPATVMPVTYSAPTRQVKLLSIKPVPTDTRAPVWDGTSGAYVSRGYDKTVDWRDGVPIWDDSISSYKQRDFSDWFLQPMDELYIREIDIETPAPVNPITLYNQNMMDAAATRARIEELLTPKRPSDNLWLTTGAENCAKADTGTTSYLPKPQYTAQDMTEIVQITFANHDGCPFETETECEIWRRKPLVRETVSPRSPKIRADLTTEFIDAARCDSNINANHPAAAALVGRYKMLMQSANACCTDGMVYSLKQAGASDGLIYKFLADDANFYGLGARCLMMSDTEFDTKYPNTATAAVAADVRNGCLCRGRQWFTAMLAPFAELYKIMPEFADAPFTYTYTDGLGRETTVSINNDVKNVLNQLSLCP